VISKPKVVAAGYGWVVFASTVLIFMMAFLGLAYWHVAYRLYARVHPRLSVGLHFEAAEWRYRDDEWYAAYRVIDADDPDQVAVELERQLAAFVRLLGRQPTHLDSHQHVHQSEPARSILLARAAELGVPLRNCSERVAYNGNFYGQTGQGEPFPEGISLETLTAMIEALPAGWTEFGCHAGYADDLDSVYTTEREEELRVLCSGDLRKILERASVRLASFHDLAFA
jgi:predicted glycoside hydrolase/deacetylase ChbG (UPF0249 family)